jgi:hypothetical protein
VTLELRKRHRRIVTTLAFILPIAFALAIAGRNPMHRSVHSLSSSGGEGRGEEALLSPSAGFTKRGSHSR